LYLFSIGSINENFFIGTSTEKEYDVLDSIKILEAANELSLQDFIGYLQSFF
jgi:hypothetical protein